MDVSFSKRFLMQSSLSPAGLTITKRNGQYRTQHERTPSRGLNAMMRPASSADTMTALNAAVNQCGIFYPARTRVNAQDSRVNQPLGSKHRMKTNGNEDEKITSPKFG